MKKARPAAAPAAPAHIGRTYMVYNVAQCGPNYYGYQIREPRPGVWTYWLHLDLWPVKPEYNDSDEYASMSAAEEAARTACRENAIRDEEKRAAQLAHSTQQPWYVVERPHPCGGTVIVCYSEQGWSEVKDWQPTCVNDPPQTLLAVVRPFVAE